MLRRLKTLAAAAAITYFVGWLRGRRSTMTRRPPLMLADHVPQPLPAQHTAGPPAEVDIDGILDPDTGAFGTTGTTMTDGGLASGATVGLGTAAREREYRERHFRGSTPGSKSYEHGGRHPSTSVHAPQGAGAQTSPAQQSDR